MILVLKALVLDPICCSWKVLDGNQKMHMRQSACERLVSGTMDRLSMLRKTCPGNCTGNGVCGQDGVCM